MRRVLMIGGGIIINIILFIFLVGAFISWGSAYDVSYENDPFWKTMGVLALLNMAGYGLYRWWPRKAARAMVTEAKPPQPLTELQKARDLFDAGHHKEAYAMVSAAVREWIAYCFGTGELTSKEALDILRSKVLGKDVIEMAAKCLHECMMVEFARQNPEKKNFEKTADLAESVIKGL
ncbi:MAG: hypothetical protein ACQESG_04935 [Nanobdellota archaeon]